MRKSRQFWQDVDLAICILVLREQISQVILEGRHTRQSLSQISKSIPTPLARDRVLFRYHEVMMARIQHHNGHMYV
jgi:hypothetical protein